MNLHDIILSNDIDNLKKTLTLLKEKKQLKNIINQYNENCMTPLHLAIEKKNQDMANLLVDFGADTNKVNQNGEIAVWYPDQKGGNYKKIITGKRYI